MRLNVRTRLLAWLLLATMPVVAAGLIVVTQFERNVEISVEDDFTNLLQLEAARISSALATKEIDGTQVAAHRDLVQALERHLTLNSDGADAIFSPLADFLVGDGTPTGDGLEAVRITNRNGEELGRSADFSWISWDTTLAARAMDERRPLFGNAYVTADGQERLGLAVPIVADDGSVLGALQMEHRLDAVVDLSIQLEDFGRTTEAVLVQPTPSGNGEMITIRRFDRDAAFTASVDAGGSTPSGQSLDAPTPRVVRLDDYRGEATVAAVQTIPATGWGLAVKIDESEAFEQANRITRSVVVGIAITLTLLLAGWATLVRPLGRRLQRTATASERVAGGDYRSRIGDRSTDEIGEMARGIDRLAADLEADIAARRRAEDELRFQAEHDKLTGLANRQTATTVIDSFGDDDDFSILFLDLDGFKKINDTYGHEAGDQVLVGVAQRLTDAVGDVATVARWGGDEFVIVLPGADAAAATARATEIDDLFRTPIMTDHGAQHVGTSVGRATSGSGIAVHDVLVDADADMYAVKRTRPLARVTPRSVLLVESALAEGRVEAFFQPVVRCVDGAPVPVGAEALVRIHSREGAVIPPAEFLAELGAGHAALELDEFVMRQAVAQLADWRRRDVVPAHFQVAINVGEASILDHSLASRIAAELVRHDLSPESLLVEIPESVEVVGDHAIAALRAVGVRLAIDDVGCKHSNLERLFDLDADIAKIDRRWIPDDGSTDTRPLDVLRNLVDQCRTLGLDLIAEGVETPAQRRMLAELGVDVFQGFLFGRPMSAPNFEHHWGRLTTAELDRQPAWRQPPTSVAQHRVEQEARLAVDHAVDGADPDQDAVELAQ